MKRSSKYYFIAFFLSVFSYSIAQNTQNEKLDIKVESAGVFTDGDYAPFWITNNNYGIGSELRNKEYLRTGIFGDKNVFNNKLNISVGADMILSHNIQSDFYIHQLYADFKYRAIGVSIGAKERNNILKNKDLSSGGLTLSNNARPIPQVEAGFHGFEEIPFTNGLLHINGAISYGKFLDDKYKKRHAGDGNYAENVFYHRKYAYIKVEKDYPLSFIIGLEMDTQWGGKFYQKGEYSGQSKPSVKNFFKVFVPMSGGSDATETDKVNITGNVYGSWQFILNYKKEDYSLKAYHEHFFEDHSGLIFKNIPDGVYGLEFNLNKKEIVSAILLEYIHTKNQSGPFLWDETPEIPIQVSAGDNYYNQVEYISLSNYGFVLGNPLLTSPIYNDGKTLFVLNSRISAMHGGISGYFTDNLKYRALVTYSKSWGTSFIPSKSVRNQFSSMLEVGYSSERLDGWNFSGALAYDNSATMVGDNLGFRLKISKVFNIR